MTKLIEVDLHARAVSPEYFVLTAKHCCNTVNSMETYRTLCAEYYDLKPHPQEQEAIAFYMEYARASHGPILEPMCGTGRFLIPIAQAGLDSEGFDASEAMLSLLTKKYDKVRCWQQLVQDFVSNKQYALIFVPYGSWGLITDIEQSLKGLQSMYDHLAPGGKLLVEIETVASAPQGEPVWHRAVRTRSDGARIALSTLPRYDANTQRYQAACVYELVVDGAVVIQELEDFQMHLYQFDEFDCLLQSAGFTQIKKYQDFAKTEAVDRATPIIIYECIKPSGSG